MKNIKRASALAVAAIMALTTVACGTENQGAPSAAPTNSPAKDNLVIGSMIWNTSNPFYTNFIKGQEETAAKLGVKLVIVDGKADSGTEVAVFQQLVTQGVDAILVTPSDAVGIAPAVKKANEAGIPVFAVNNRVDETAAEIITFIGADDVEFGRQQARLLAETLPEGGNVAYMMGTLGTSAQLLRKKGFDEVIAEHSNIKIVEEQTANWDAAQALKVTQDWVAKYPTGELAAIVAQGPEAANAAKYTQESGRTEIKYVVGDYPADVRAGIRAGYIFGTINQDPNPQGVRSVEAAVEWLTGDQSKVTRPNEYLELPIITAKNVEDYPAAWGEE